MARQGDADHHDGTTDSNVFLVPPQALPPIIPILAEILEPAIERSNGRETFKSVMESVADGHSVVFVLVKNRKTVAAAICSVVQYANKRNLRLSHVAGEGIKELLNTHTQMLNFAIKHGCDAIELIGRAGWERTLKPLGYEKHAILMERPIHERTGDATDATDDAHDRSGAEPDRDAKP